MKNVIFNEDSELNTIGDFAFKGCRGIASLRLSSGVVKVGVQAFFGWSNLQTIYVEGYASQQQAEAVWGTVWKAGCKAIIIFLG